MGNTLKMRPKRGWSSEFLPASEARTDISFEYLVPAVFRVFHGRIGWFCWKGVVENADETPRSEFLRLEPVTGLGKGNFNASGKDTSTPGVGGSATSENAGGEVFLGKGRVFIIYELAKVLGGEATLALSGFDMLGNIRNRVKQGIARGALVGGFLFGLVDLGVVLASEKRSNNGREEGLKTNLIPVKIKRLNNMKLLRALRANRVLGTLHHMPLQLPLVLKASPTLSTVKVSPGIILAIPSEHRVILGIRKLDTALLASGVAALLPMRDLIRVPCRLVHGLEIDAILVDVNTSGVGI